MNVIKIKIILLQVNYIFDILLKFVEICDKIKFADIPHRIRQDFIYGVQNRRLCPFFYIHRLFLTESMKGGMLMKSKHCTYGKRSAFCAFVYRGLRDNFRRKSNVTAPARTVNIKRSPRA